MSVVLQLSSVTFIHTSTKLAGSSEVSDCASSLTFASYLNRPVSVFHSELKTWLFGKSFPPQTFAFPTGLIPRTLGPFNVFILLNGWICLHGVLD